MADAQLTDLLLREIRDELRALRMAITGAARASEKRRQPRLTSEDLANLAVLLPIVALRMRGRTFNVAELFEQAKHHDEQALRRALGSVGNALQVGRLFTRAHGIAVDGLCLERQGRDRDGSMWRCVVADRHTSSQ